jgi:hypothetical protein
MRRSLPRVRFFAPASSFQATCASSSAELATLLSLFSKVIENLGGQFSVGYTLN